MLEFSDPTPAAMLDVCMALRPDDRREVFATREREDPFRLFCDLMAAEQARLWGDIAWAPDRLGQPVAFLAVYHRSPGCGSAVMLSTAALTPRHAGLIARRVRETVIPAMERLGLRRVDCEAWEGNRGARRFLRACGAEAMPAPRLQVGKRGEAYREHVWFNRALARDRETA